MPVAAVKKSCKSRIISHLWAFTLYISLYIDGRTSDYQVTILRVHGGMIK